MISVRMLSGSSYLLTKVMQMTENAQFPLSSPVDPGNWITFVSPACQTGSRKRTEFPSCLGPHGLAVGCWELCVYRADGGSGIR